MGLRFNKRINLIPGLRLNLGKTGVTATVGVKGARYTFGHNGQRATLGLPGTGLYWTEKLGKKGRKATPAAVAATPTPNALDGALGTVIGAAIWLVGAALAFHIAPVLGWAVVGWFGWTVAKHMIANWK